MADFKKVTLEEFMEVDDVQPHVKAEGKRLLESCSVIWCKDQKNIYKITNTEKRNAGVEKPCN